MILLKLLFLQLQILILLMIPQKDNKSGHSRRQHEHRHKNLSIRYELKPLLVLLTHLTSSSDITSSEITLLLYFEQ